MTQKHISAIPNKFFRWFYRHLWIIFYIMLFASAFFCLFIAPSIGKSAGMATCSFNGVTSGLSEGADAGEESGLSAKDTETKIVDKITASGNLEVLLVDICLTDLYTQGNDYAALFVLKGEGVFTVNLLQSQTAYDPIKNQVTIKLPQPEFTPYLDDSTIEELTEYKRPLFNGSTEKGYKGYLNTREQLDLKIQEEFESDATMEQARSLAEKQVTQLAKSVCGSTASINIDFMESEE